VEAALCFLVPQIMLKASVSHIYPKGMVTLTVLPDSSEDNLSAHLAVQLASHFLKKRQGCVFVSCYQPFSLSVTNFL